MIILKILYALSLVYLLSIIIKVILTYGDKEYMQNLRNATYYECLTTEVMDELFESLTYMAYSVRENNSIVFKGKFIINPYKTNYEFKIVVTEDNKPGQVTGFQLIDADLDIMIMDINILKFVNPTEYIEDFNIQSSQLSSLRILINRLKKKNIKVAVTGNWF